MAVVMNNSIYCDITPRSQLKVNGALEEHVSYIFRVDWKAKKETNTKRGSVCCLLMLLYFWAHS
jgi:hypothetical protein